MKILIVGDGHTLVRRLLAAVRKDDWETYLLMGKTGSARKTADVFEQFLFPYDSDAIGEVIDSVEPDVVLFTGLYDACFDWDNLQKASVQYLAGLGNLLEACGRHPGLRFFCLSSHEVFAPWQGEADEDTAPQPESQRGLIAQQGEVLCLNHRLVRGLDATVIRLDHLYAPVRSRDEYRGVLESMALEGCSTGEIAIPARAGRLSGLFVSDAVEGIFRILASHKREQSIYHLSCDRMIDVAELAQKIAAQTGATCIRLSDEGGDAPAATLHLRCQRAADEFGFHTWHYYDETLPALCAQIRKRKDDLLPKAWNARAGRRARVLSRAREVLRYLLPYLLNLLGAAAAFWLQAALKNGGYPSSVDMLLLYPLLFAGIYGKRQAIFSALLSVCYAFFSSDDLFGMMIDYNTYLWVAEVFVAAMLVGHLRDCLEIVKNESEEEVQALAARQTELSVINDTNARIKRAYEKRLIEYNGSLGRIYKVTKGLDGLRPGEVLFSAVEAVAEVMGAKDVAIYAVENKKFARIFSATSQKARQLGKSLCYPELTELYSTVMQRRVYINKQLDPSLPLMANGIFDGERLTFLVMVWGLGLESLSLYQANQLTVLCSLIMMSLNHAATYLKTLEEERFLKGTRIMEHAAFAELLQLYSDARRRRLAEFTLLKVDMDGHKPKKLNDALSRCIRMSDHVGQIAEEELAILLPNTALGDTPVILERLRAAGLSCSAEGAVE